MTKKMKFSAFALCLALLPACAGTTLNDDPQSNMVADDEFCDETCDETPAAPIGAGGEYTSYSDVSADYKAYGERAPRDQYISQAGKGDSLSSSIPPAVEDEVSDYEEEIKDSGGAATDAAADSSDKAGSPDDPVDDWLAEEGRTLKDLLTDWADKSGWRLVWKTNRNYTLTAGAMFRGRFADVTSALIRAFARAKPAPVGTFYKGNRVLVVETLEDENAYE